LSVAASMAPRALSAAASFVSPALPMAASATPLASSPTWSRLDAWSSSAAFCAADCALLVALLHGRHGSSWQQPDTLSAWSLVMQLVHFLVLACLCEWSVDEHSAARVGR
jgi:hypothetical protein